MDPRPLAGVTVIDLTRVLAGPYCTMILCDLGADVIKIEAPEVGDDSRGYGPFVHGRSAYFMSLNRGKKSIALNLKDGVDRAALGKMLAQADVLVENFRPGALDKLGFGWDALHPRYPKLIYAAASGFGHTGPSRGKAAYDMVVQGMGGIMSITGWPDGPPTRVGASVGDITAGLFTAIGVCAALHKRKETGVGTKVDVAMLDCQLAILENAIARYATTGVSPGPLGARHPSIAPFEAYATQDSHIIAAAGNDKLFRTLCAAIGRPEVADDPRYATNAGRVEHADAMKQDLESALRQNTTAHWVGVLEGVGVPCGPINNVEQALNDPQVRARNMVVTMDDGSGGQLTLAGNPIKISGVEDPTTRPPAPDLDADRAAILKRFGID